MLQNDSSLLNNTRTTRVMNIVYSLLLVVLACLFTFLFYRQIIAYNGAYLSDTHYYVECAKANDGVRLVSIVFRLIYAVSQSEMAIAIYMTIIVIATILCNYYLLKYIVASFNVSAPQYVLQVLSIVMIFTGNMYIPRFHKIFYKKAWSTYAWHSPTQQTMMLFALISIIFLFKLLESYLIKINGKQWLALLICSMLSTWAKPSFILVMCPTIIVLFLIELFKKCDYSISYKFKRLFTLGLAFIPSGILSLLLNSVYFGSGEESEGSSVIFSADRFLENGLSHFIVYSLCCLSFSVIVLLFNAKRLKSIDYRFVLILLICGVIEWMLLYEGGNRALHGNFSWGKMFSCYVFALYSFGLAVENFFNKAFLSKNKTMRAVYFASLTLIVLVTLASQLYYFYALLNGSTYNI